MAVTISKGFWMGRYEVTQMEYATVVGKNPSFFKGDLNRPVEQVNWNDAVNYCAQLTLREQAAGRIPSGCRYRLPTEAEWEYACRGWTSTRFSYGEDPGYTNLTAYSWHNLNSAATTHPVGQKLPNGWGLYDMHGNVWEWCQDWYGSYPTGIVIDPEGLPNGADRVLRGGSWNANPWICRSAMRGTATSRMPSVIGFRVILAADR